MQTLEWKIEKSKPRVDLWLDRTASDINKEDKLADACRNYHLLLAIKSIDNLNISNAKTHLNICALTDELKITKYNSRQADYSKNIYYSVLTDHEALIQRYSKLRYQRGKNAELSMDEMVLKGYGAVLSNTFQFFMANDFKHIERNLNIVETLLLPKKRGKSFQIDFDFYKALLSKDKSKCEEILDELVDPKLHKKRNDNIPLNNYVSQPALGYAKLAWRQGVEVNIDSPLIPKAMLPIEPLENYEIPYGFLKASNRLSTSI